MPADDDEDNNALSKQWAQVLRCFTRLPGNPAVVVAAHPTKHAERYSLLPRGGGAFLNEVDCNLTLWADLDFPEGRTCYPVGCHAGTSRQRGTNVNAAL